ncbi:hypothetical protein V1514DRAFT_46831 [Lipomyces japonicus]|uniref:uncharacterized protein n=1 Tax=Lipomyces japonicus TaxID=56871 RepID=UPI0034CD9811
MAGTIGNGAEVKSKAGRSKSRKSTTNRKTAKQNGILKSIDNQAKASSDTENNGEETDESNEADQLQLPGTTVPFSIVKPDRSQKKRKTKAGNDEFAEGFDDTGAIDSDAFSVVPHDGWLKLTPYRHFVVGSERFSIGDYVYVNHAHIQGSSAILTNPKMYWIGRVLEIRAQDHMLVYIRVFWMYWPAELPEGREYYHGKKELIASNHMDIIDAMTVAGKAPVSHWKEQDDDDKLSELFWRQSYDSYLAKLGPVRRHCKCERFYNPDTTMVWCGSCETWLHEYCVIKDLKEKYDKDIIESPKKDKGKNKKKGTDDYCLDSSHSNADEPVTIEIDDSEAKASYVAKDGTVKFVPITCLNCGIDVS